MRDDREHDDRNILMGVMKDEWSKSDDREHDDIRYIDASDAKKQTY